LVEGFALIGTPEKWKMMLNLNPEGTPVKPQWLVIATE
jgi:hypothetical protein